MDEDVTQIRQIMRELVSASAGASTAPATAGYISNLSPSEAKKDEFDQVSYAVRQVLQMGKEHAMLDQLNSYMARKDVEIEKTCASNYQVLNLLTILQKNGVLNSTVGKEFVHAVDQVLKLRTDATLLKDSILQLKHNLNVAGGNIVYQVQATFFGHVFHFTF